MSKLQPSDVTESLLPPAGSVWRDTYAYTDRTAVVITTRPAGVVQGVETWYVDAQEEYGWKRVFHMYAHGFLSRYERVDRT